MSPLRKKKSFCIVSSYPPSSDYSHTALAAFTANLIRGITTHVTKDTAIVVYADVLDPEQKGVHKNQHPALTIERIWQRNHVGSLFTLTKTLITSPHKKILFQYEWSTFGDAKVYNIFFLIILLLLVLAGKHTYIVFHGVIVDKKIFTTLRDHGFGGRWTTILTSCTRLFYALASVLCKKMIVLEEYLKQQLTSYTSIHPAKIAVIPHGVDTHLKTIPRDKARKQLGTPPQTYMIGCFGFITPYKGSHTLLSLFRTSHIPDNVRLYFIGGKSLHNTSTWYDTYYQKIEAEMSQNKNVYYTGFVGEPQIQSYLSACDLIIVPHLVFISSSGPLSLAFTFQKPVLLAHSLAGYMQTADFSACLAAAGLGKDDIFFEPNPTSFATLVKKVQTNPTPYIEFSQRMRAKRNWNEIAHIYMQTLDA